MGKRQGDVPFSKVSRESMWIDSGGFLARLAVISRFRRLDLAFARTLGLWVGHGKETLID